MPERSLEEIVAAYDAEASRLERLQAWRVRDILLVASLYDSFTLSEGQHLTELIFGTYFDLALTTVPAIRRVATRGQALELLAERSFDLVITMSQVADMGVTAFGQAVKALHPELAVILLAYSMTELEAENGSPTEIPGVDRVFIWRGDVRLFVAIIKLLEDERNAPHDTEAAGVRVILLVEDSVPFYSSYLPLLLDELVQQSASLIAEEVNLGQRMLRRRLRPKILLATTFEQAWSLYERYRGHFLCVIADVRFPRAGVEDPTAGLTLLRRIRKHDRTTQFLIQSSELAIEGPVRALGAAFARKHSPTILNDLRAFMMRHLGFGEFVFRLPDGTEVGRAADVSAMIRVLADVPAEALQFHGMRHDFSNWLMARTEYRMASALRKLNVADFVSLEAMRSYLLSTLSAVREDRRRGQVEDFNADTFDATTPFVRIGGGSLGGKGRGLAFMHEMLSRGDLAARFADVEVFVPPSVVVGTAVFDRFLGDHALMPFALRAEDDRHILQRFLAAPLPADIRADLAAFLSRVRGPIAVRSSSLLEDSQMLPAAGIYPTHMLPNVSEDLAARLADLEAAVRHVYASTFFQRAKAYLAATANLVEDEKMAVVIQQVVGRRHDDLVYPDLAGTAASFNFYPVREMRAEEGVASVALGLGKTVVEGERAVRFSPAHPEWLPQFSSPADTLENAQRTFRALDLGARLDFRDPEADGANVVRLDLTVAERHDTLWPVASTFSPENDTVYDGVSRPGVRLVTMAPILKHGLFPLPELLRRLLRLGEIGMSVPVEMEFAANLQGEGSPRRSFALLQIRPLGYRVAHGDLALDQIDPAAVFVRASHALGVGRHAEVRDILAVRRDTFDRGRTAAVAAEIGERNAALRAEGRPYLLIGPGRWGTADPWLGIPVQWTQIAGARVIVECALGGLDVEPSQGTHFFHNLTSRGIGYFTIDQRGSGRVDWAWLDGLAPRLRTDHTVLYRLDEPLEVRVDGRTGEGVVLKRPPQP